MPEPSAVKVMGKTEGFSWAAMCKLRRLLVTSNTDVVHSHNLGTLIYAVLATHGGRTCPIVHGEHGQLQVKDLSIKRLIQRRLLFRFCREIHTVSAGVRDHLQELGLDPRQKILVTPNGVDCDRFSPTENHEISKIEVELPSHAIVVGIVGRLVALKRHAMLFEAFAQLAGSFPNLHLLVVGDGGEDRETLIEAMATHPNANRLHWVGHRDDLERYYQAMDLLAAPSEVEGLSNGVLEAMACAVPVLAHSACGNAEVITDGEDGYLAEITNAATLERQLRERLAAPKELRRIGVNARNTVQTRFSMAAMAESYRRLYWDAREA